MRKGGGHSVLELHLSRPDVWSWFATAEASIEFEIKLLFCIADIKQKVTQVCVEHQGRIDLIYANILLLPDELFKGSPPTVHL